MRCPTGDVVCSPSCCSEDLMTQSSVCIFCLTPLTSDNSRSEEHVIPYALGIHDMVLPPGSVCDSCNNGPLSRIDHGLVERLRFLSAWFGVQTRSGTARHIGANHVITHREDVGRTIIIDERDGHRQIDAQDGLGVVNLPGEGPPVETNRWDQYDDGSLAFAHGYAFSFDEAVTRGIVKIAYETLALREGSEHVLQDQFAWMRTYLVSKGNRPPARHLIVGAPIRPDIEHPVRAGVWFYDHPGFKWKIAVVELHGFTFIVSLDSVRRDRRRMEQFLNLLREGIGKSGIAWTLPPRAWALMKPDGTIWETLCTEDLLEPWVRTLREFGSVVAQIRSEEIFRQQLSLNFDGGTWSSPLPNEGCIARGISLVERLLNGEHSFESVVAVLTERIEDTDAIQQVEQTHNLWHANLDGYSLGVQIASQRVRPAESFELWRNPEALSVMAPMQRLIVRLQVVWALQGLARCAEAMIDIADRYIAPMPAVQPVAVSAPMKTDMSPS